MKLTYDKEVTDKMYNLTILLDRPRITFAERCRIATTIGLLLETWTHIEQTKTKEVVSEQLAETQRGIDNA